MKIFSLLVFLAQIQTNNLVIPQGGTPQLLIPAAGSVQGANGTFFRSDITLVNYTSHEQRVQLRWLPQGVTGNGIPLRDITIPALSGIVSEDFAASVMAQTGLGAILATGVTPDGLGDSTARLFATSRIWSNQPGLSNGTVSQSFPSLPTTAINSATQLSILGLRRDDRYRLNVGIVNLDPSNEQRFQITVAGASAAAEVTFVTVPPRSIVQTPMVGGPLTNLQINVTNVSTPIRTATWVAYGSSVDNTTGDAWSELGFIAPPDQP